jgi:hypothetical protein
MDKKCYSAKFSADPNGIIFENDFTSALSAACDYVAKQCWANCEIRIFDYSNKLIATYLYSIDGWKDSKVLAWNNRMKAVGEY